MGWYESVSVSIATVMQCVYQNSWWRAEGTVNGKMTAKDAESPGFRSLHQKKKNKTKTAAAGQERISTPQHKIFFLPVLVFLLLKN
jgi:hypothetical protein